MFEVVAITYLMGRGNDYHTAHRIVETWEVGKSFPPFQGHPQHYPYGTPQHQYLGNLIILEINRYYTEGLSIPYILKWYLSSFSFSGFLRPSDS
jgi:hypothetical protein